MKYFARDAALARYALKMGRKRSSADLATHA